MSAYTLTIPRLETERLIMREYRQTDFDAFAEFYWRADAPRIGMARASNTFGPLGLARVWVLGG
jgi:hypothetical protein